MAYWSMHAQIVHCNRTVNSAGVGQPKTSRIIKNIMFLVNVFLSFCFVKVIRLKVKKFT